MPQRLDSRVWITGIGLATSLGLDRESSWQALRDGEHGLRELEGTLAGHHGGVVPGSNQRSHASGLLMKAAEEAIDDSGLLESGVDPERTGVVAGSSKGDIGSLGESLLRLANGESIEPWINHWPNAGASAIARRWNLQGPSLSPIAACATGLVAALRGHQLIATGACDVVVVGAGDASLDGLVLGAFRRMGVLAKVDGDPGRAIRPWNRDRSGFLVGEGAAILVLEAREHALHRGARPYAEFAGGASGSDAFHETGLNPDPRGLAELILRAIERSSLDPSTLDHVNVHGTATRSNDPLECQALRLALGDDSDRVACSANKPQIGHLLGAAGAAELAFTALAVRDGFVPPTLNLEHPDPQCDLDGTPRVGRARPIRAALKLSIGFGGHFAAAVLKQVEGDSR